MVVERIGERQYFCCQTSSLPGKQSFYKHIVSMASATNIVYPDITVEFDIIRNSEHESGKASKDRRQGLVGPSERTSCLQRTAPILAVHQFSTTTTKINHRRHDEANQE